MSKKPNHAILLMHCPDVKGIVHAVTEFVLTNQGNIIKLDQHVDEDEDRFFMRVEWDLADFTIPEAKIGEYFQTLLGSKFHIQWKLHFSTHMPRLALFVSKYGHCLYDLLSRYESGDLNVEIPLIISNHKKFENLATRFNIPFHHYPITKSNKIELERLQIDLLKKNNIDVIILARYMQILSGQFVGAFTNRIINIHHSSLPAFAGADPYRAAFKRGVKFMGATSHYVTEDLDEGPIIAQDVIPISHRDSIADMKRKGKDIEKIVLAKAIYSHITHNVLTFKNKTVVFE